MVISAILVFLTTALGDVVWARWTLAVTALRPLSAAVWAVGIGIAGAVSIVAISENWVFTLPALAGYFVGTYLSVLHARRTLTNSNKRRKGRNDG